MMPPSESLRMRVVEAGARAEWPWEADAVIAANWRKAGVRRVKEEIAANILDKMLDCLTENADEWVEGAGRLVLTTDSIYEALIATLREPTDG